MSIRNDLTGMRFGRLTAERPCGSNQRGTLWLCRCDCGTLVAHTGSRLKYGETVSCGCRYRELAAENTTHGATVGGQWTAEYAAWKSAKARCFNPRDPGYKNYGGRGITMCPEWVSDFAAFFAHVGPRPLPVHSLDRKNVNGNYEPGNLRWATRSQQQRNRREPLRTYEYNGENLILTDLARALGVKFSVLRQQVKKKPIPEVIAFLRQPILSGRHKRPPLLA